MAATTENDPLYRAIETPLKGPEISQADRDQPTYHTTIGGGARRNICTTGPITPRAWTVDSQKAGPFLKTDCHPYVILESA
ncbi:hypothetical protein [[Mycobacterium] fortunisiensis]|uniref:hypothetical protein n=1 Tax=[Mycobacterium] fortunisiensis TaxID=2600579 RepID=UPI001C25B1A6|nr:hypothetical protein [[Mycobacterium] fortunisiensis]